MDVKSFYLAIGGDYNDALARMMNDSLIARMLSKFMNDNAVERMVSLYESKDYRTLFSTAHTLKGVAGNLSLTPLFNLACTITEATRNEDGANLDKEIDELKKVYSNILEAYNKYLA